MSMIRPMGERIRLLAVLLLIVLAGCSENDSPPGGELFDPLAADDPVILPGEIALADGSSKDAGTGIPFDRCSAGESAADG